MPRGVYIRTEKSRFNGSKNGFKKGNKKPKGANSFKRGHPSYVTEKSREKMSEANKGVHYSPNTEFGKGDKKISGENNFNWKGDNVGYFSLHDWVRLHSGIPEVCEHCGKTGLTGRQIHWANIDHKYRRVLEDYIRLCISCHRKYDNIFNKK